MTELNGISRSDRSMRSRTVRDYVAIGFRNRRLIFLSFVAIFLGCVLAIVVIPPKYEAQTRILLDSSRLSGGRSGSTPSMTASRTKAHAEV